MIQWSGTIDNVAILFLCNFFYGWCDVKCFVGTWPVPIHVPSPSHVLAPWKSEEVPRVAATFFWGQIQPSPLFLGNARKEFRLSDWWLSLQGHRIGWIPQKANGLSVPPKPEKSAPSLGQWCMTIKVYRFTGFASGNQTFQLRRYFVGSPQRILTLSHHDAGQLSWEDLPLAQCKHLVKYWICLFWVPYWYSMLQGGGLQGEAAMLPEQSFSANIVLTQTITFVLNPSKLNSWLFVGLEWYGIPANHQAISGNNG